MLSPTTARRVLITALVLAALALAAGCAAYEERTAPQLTGTVTVTWSFEQTFHDDRCGEAIYLGPGHYLLRLRGRPTFNDAFRLHCLGHEALHAMGGSHQ